jgi:hypothetical protein
MLAAAPIRVPLLQGNRVLATDRLVMVVGSPKHSGLRSAKTTRGCVTRAYRTVCGDTLKPARVLASPQDNRLSKNTAPLQRIFRLQRFIRRFPERDFGPAWRPFSDKRVCHKGVRCTSCGCTKIIARHLSRDRDCQAFLFRLKSSARLSAGEGGMVTRSA